MPLAARRFQITPKLTNLASRATRRGVSSQRKVSHPDPTVVAYLPMTPLASVISFRWRIRLQPAMASNAAGLYLSRLTQLADQLPVLIAAIGCVAVDYPSGMVVRLNALWWQIGTQPITR